MENGKPDPKEVLASLSDLINSNQISKDDVLKLFPQQPQAQGSPTPTKKPINLQIILYYVGALIVLMGIVFFIAQFWHTMPQISKVFITMVPAISTYSLGYYFYVTQNKKEFGHAFFTISAALFPLAISTTLDFANISATKIEGGVINFAFLFAIFAVSYSYTKAVIFLPFSIAAGTGLFFTFTNYLFKFTAPPTHFAQYQAMIIGISYVLLGYYWEKERFMMNLLYLFGTTAFLGSALSLTGFNPRIDVLWQLAYPFLLAGTYYLSIRLQNKTILIMATLFTFGEILKLTAEYFAKSIGWPISLIFCGLIIMGMGYFSFEINRKLLHKQTPAT